MVNHWRSTLRTLAAETRGAEIAEAAAVLPLMFMFLLGIFWFGQAFSIYGAITRAAQEGARAGAVPYCATCAGTNTFTQYGTNAVNAVQTAMIASKLDPSLARLPRLHLYLTPAAPIVRRVTPGVQTFACRLQSR